MIDVSQQTLLRLFRYDPTLGQLFWNVAPANNTTVGQRAGYARPGRARRYVKIKGRSFPEHRLVWVLANGPIPDGYFVDHRDRDEGNNRIDNLRLLTRIENCQNLIHLLRLELESGQIREVFDHLFHILDLSSPLLLSGQPQTLFEKSVPQNLKVFFLIELQKLLHIDLIEQILA